MNWCFGHEWTVAVLLFDFSGYLFLSQWWNEIKDEWKIIYLNRVILSNFESKKSWYKDS